MGENEKTFKVILTEFASSEPFKYGDSNIIVIGFGGMETKVVEIGLSIKDARDLVHSVVNSLRDVGDKFAEDVIRGFNEYIEKELNGE